MSAGALNSHITVYKWTSIVGHVVLFIICRFGARAEETRVSAREISQHIIFHSFESIFKRALF